MSDHYVGTPNDRASRQVTLIMPCLAEYVGVARLAILGIANRVAFTYDEVEDVRLAVGEACTHAIERATEHRAALAASTGAHAEVASLKIVSTVEQSTLTIEVIDTIPLPELTATDASGALDNIDYHKLGTVLMEILVDQVTFDSGNSGTTVRLVKHAAQAASVPV